MMIANESLSTRTSVLTSGNNYANCLIQQNDSLETISTFNLHSEKKKSVCIQLSFFASSRISSQPAGRALTSY